MKIQVMRACKRPAGPYFLDTGTAFCPECKASHKDTPGLIEHNPVIEWRPIAEVIAQFFREAIPGIRL